MLLLMQKFQFCSILLNFYTIRHAKIMYNITFKFLILNIEDTLNLNQNGNGKIDTSFYYNIFYLECKYLICAAKNRKVQLPKCELLGLLVLQN